MMVREDIVTSAVDFLRDPGVASSPIDKRIAFLQSKNLTQDEIDAALARAGEDPLAPGAPSQAPRNSSNYGYQSQQVTRQQPQVGYGAYQNGYWQQPPPQELPRRDWRDWFIMATVMGGVSYGLYFIAKRYVYPIIAPPTPPQLEQDKQSIDESFAKAFALLDQLGTDTESLKSSEEARTQRLDVALAEVESVISELKSASRRREDEGRKISDEVRGLKDLIPKAMDAQKENSDTRLRELNTELRSLKTLVGNRMGSASGASTGSIGSGRQLGTGPYGSTAQGNLNGSGTNTPPNQSSAAGAGNANPAAGSISNGAGESQIPTSSASMPATPPVGTRKDSQPSFISGATSGRASIPAWQMAAANKNKNPPPPSVSGTDGGTSTESSGTSQTT